MGGGILKKSYNSTGNNYFTFNNTRSPESSQNVELRAALAPALQLFEQRVTYTMKFAFVKWYKAVL